MFLVLEFKEISDRQKGQEDERDIQREMQSLQKLCPQLVLMGLFKTPKPIEQIKFLFKLVGSKISSEKHEVCSICLFVCFFKINAKKNFHVQKKKLII